MKLVKRMLVMVVLAMISSSSAVAAEIRLRSSVACSAPVVRLADAAEIRAEDSALVEALGLIALCPSPQIGHERVLAQHDVRQILLLSGIEPSKIALTGSEHIVLQHGAATMATAKTRPTNSMVRQALHAVEIQPERPRPAPQTLPLKPASADVTDSKPEPLVERGTIVTVYSRRPGVRITAAGKALEAGANGELIPVEMSDSKQRVLARITGPQTAEVATNAAPPNGAVTQP